MNVDEATGLAAKIDKFFTAWGPVFGRHWGKMIIAFLLATFGWFCWTVKEDVENDIEDPYNDEYYEDEYYEEGEEAFQGY